MSKISTPSPKTRKAHHCRSCGMPMLGHKKGDCSPQAKRAALQAAHDDITLAMDALDLQSESPSRTTGTNRRRSSQGVKRQPSLESLSESSENILTSLITPTKPRRSAVTSADVKSEERGSRLPPPHKETMPGTLLIDEDRDEDFLNRDLTLSLIPSIEETERKKRKSLRVSLPGTRSSLRLERARSLDTSKVGDVLQSGFIKTTVQPAALFGMSAEDCDCLEKHAARLGLETQYFKRIGSKSEPHEQNINLIIVAKNSKGIDDMRTTMAYEAEDADASSATVASYFSKQLASTGIAIVAGAAAMWAGLAFS